FVPSPFRVHGAVLGGELHSFAGGFVGTAHVIYNPTTDSWRVGPSMPVGVTDPATDALNGKAILVGGHPVALMQIFDPTTNSWSSGPPIAGAVNGIDNTAGAILGPSFHLVGGFDGITSINTHWRFHLCNAGELSSAAFLPFVVDGDGTATGIGNERTAL